MAMRMFSGRTMDRMQTRSGRELQALDGDHAAANIGHDA
jgi:hypothetical protein